MQINFRGYQKYRRRSWLETSSYLKDDCINIHYTIGVVQTRVGDEKRYVIPVPPPEMIQNLKGLLESKIGSDITFQVGNEFFRAHKLILAARSPAMLLFLYSDELPETHELSDLDPLCTPTTIAQHLLAAADRFGLARLKLMCEEKLCEDITANTVANTLAIADVYNCMELKTVCLNFAARHENLEEVMKSDGYADLEKSLVTDLLKTSAAIDKN
ncbi:hypothetical protein MKX03_009819 [Papaver bracteatum]|nr:hypothetical protein MKX03_009819 [Papaver bracteatum]